MKSLLSSRCVKIASITLVLITSMFAAVQADAGSCHYRHHGHHWWHYWAYAPIAMCAQYNTNTPLLPYVCCQERDRHGQKMWGNTWVYGGSCKAASSYAMPDMRCNSTSPVYGTDHPIIANCQFSTAGRVYDVGHHYYGHYKN